MLSFFEQFAATAEVEEFAPVTIAGDGDHVVSVVRIRTRNRATGRQVAMNLHHFFTFSDGRIAYYRGSEDTAQVEASLRP